MRFFWMVLVCLALIATPVLAQGLKVEDFRPAIPSRTMLSTDWALSRYPGQKMLLFEDKTFGYKLYTYVLTRELVKDHIQAVIDEFNIFDPENIEDMINYYLDVTPQEREVLVVLLYTAPNISNRYYINHLSSLDQKVYLEYGVKPIQKHVLSAREAMAKERRDYPTEDEMIYKAGTRPLYLDVDKDYLYYPERVVLEDQGWDNVAKCYRWMFAFTFTDEDIARLEEFILNNINVEFSLVLSDPELFSYKTLRPHVKYQILRLVDPEFVDFMEGIEEMTPPKEPVKVSKKKWLK